MSKKELKSLQLGKFHTYLDVRPDWAYIQKSKFCPYSSLIVNGITQKFYKNIGLNC